MRNNKVSVLIVDDHPYFVDRMRGLLGEVDNIDHIDSAHNFSDAMQLLEAAKHQVVLLDISMPGKNGIDLLEQIRLKEMGCTVIMISNLSATYYRQECKRLGAHYFLDKSSDFDLVPGIISNVQLN